MDLVSVLPVKLRRCRSPPREYGAGRGELGTKDKLTPAMAVAAVVAPTALFLVSELSIEPALRGPRALISGYVILREDFLKREEREITSTPVVTDGGGKVEKEGVGREME